MLKELEKQFRSYAIPNLTHVIIIGMLLSWAMIMADPGRAEAMMLRRDMVLQGEVWRLITFVFLPPGVSPLCLLFGLYLFGIMGTALERYWGAFRYNCFLALGWLLTVVITMSAPMLIGTNTFLLGSVFLAFAHLNPNFMLMIFLVLPVRVRWLALLTWCGYGLAFLAGDLSVRLMILAATGNFLIFFGKDIVQRMRSGHGRMVKQASAFGSGNEAFHTCARCNVTDLDEPELRFRVCTRCHDEPEYCERCLPEHEHIRKPPHDATD